MSSICHSVNMSHRHSNSSNSTDTPEFSRPRFIAIAIQNPRHNSSASTIENNDPIRQRNRSPYRLSFDRPTWLQEKMKIVVNSFSIYIELLWLSHQPVKQCSYSSSSLSFLRSRGNSSPRISIDYHRHFCDSYWIHCLHYAKYPLPHRTTYYSATSLESTNNG